MELHKLQKEILHNAVFPTKMFQEIKKKLSKSQFSSLKDKKSQISSLTDKSS